MLSNEDVRWREIFRLFGFGRKRQSLWESVCSETIFALKALKPSHYDLASRDIVLAFIAVGAGVLLLRRFFSRLRTPLQMMEATKGRGYLYGYAVHVNDSDNLRFWHTSVFHRIFNRHRKIGN